MGEETKISWTATVLKDGSIRPGKTQNDWWGCRKVSAECVNCYAETLSRRVGRDIFGLGKPRWRTSEKNRRLPLKWDAEAAQLEGRVFVFAESMGDIWDPEVPIEWLASYLSTIAATRNLTWLLLTKRPELWRSRLDDAWHWYADQASLRGDSLPNLLADPGWVMVGDWLKGIAPPNVWIGWTAGTQQSLDERSPHGLGIPAVKHFVSIEPMLEPIDASAFMWPVCASWPAEFKSDREARAAGATVTLRRQRLVHRDSRFIDWVIVGGESGNKARPFDLAWARAVRDQCAAAEVPFFFKQAGSNHVDTMRCEFHSFQHWVNKASTRVPEGAVLTDAVGRVCRVGKDFMRARDEGTFPVGFRTTVRHLNIRGEGRDIEDWPLDLQVQQWPA